MAFVISFMFKHNSKLKENKKNIKNKIYNVREKEE